MTKYQIAAELAGVGLVVTQQLEGAEFQAVDDYVFMRPRRFTKRGLYGFLMFAWVARWGTKMKRQARWVRRYRRARWVQQLAADMHVRLPKTLFDEERARLREELSEYADRIPPHLRPADDEYHAAVRWAAR